MKNIAQANNLFRQKKYQQARDIYLELLKKYPELKNVIDFNLRECEKRCLQILDKERNSPKEGLCIILINTNYQTKNLHITRAIYNALVRHQRVDKVIFADYSSVVNDCRTHGADILLAIDGQKIIPEILYKASRYSKKSVLWTFDDPYTSRDSLAFQGMFDVIFSNDLASAKLYTSKSAHLPLASPLMGDFYMSNNDTERDDFFYDIFFCGTAWPNRIDDLNQLIASRPNLRYKFCMPFNKHLPKKKLTGFPVTSYIFPANFMDVIRVARRSKIVLGLHRSFGENKDMASSNSPGPRVFEIAGMGAFQIVDSICGAGLYYQNHKEIVLYDGFDDLLYQLDCYLQNTTKRKEIAKNAFEKTMTSHTYSNRLDYMFSIIDSN